MSLFANVNQTQICFEHFTELTSTKSWLKTHLFQVKLEFVQEV